LRDRFRGGSGPFPEDMVHRAETIFSELNSSMAKPVLLHGDLHHWNILSSDRGSWVVIDPKGVVGEPAYEAGALLRNPFPSLLKMPGLNQITSRRVDQLSQGLGFDRQRIIGWAFSQAVLSGWWSYEDNSQDWQEQLEIAELFLESD
jgi:streptomycin 6-kinase